jgi:hypothetical protein
MCGRKAANAADSAASAIFRVGRKVAGESGGKAANAVTGALLGRTQEKCSDACGHCNVSCVQGTCNH